MSQDRFIAALKQVLERREREKAPLRTQRVLGRGQDGTVQLQRLDSECATRGARDSFYTGQTISEPAGLGSAFNRQGTTGVAAISAEVTPSPAVLWVERLDPNRYLPGREYTVTVIGRGFDPSVRFEFLRPGRPPIVNDDITVVSATFLDEFGFELVIQVPEHAVRYTTAPLAYGRGLSLRNRKEDAYAVALETEDRLVYLLSSPHAVAWDPFGDRLLYHRTEWHYKVLKGTEEIWDPGTMETVICSLPRALGDLSDVEQGFRLAVIEIEELSEVPETETGEPPFGWPRIVEVIAVDPSDGTFAVYSHREDELDSFKTTLQAFSPVGGSLSASVFPQPADLAAPWVVPHAVIHETNIYALERETTFWPTIGPPGGRIVRRSVGTVGSLAFTFSFGNRYRFPHSLAVDPENERLYVLSTLLIDPGPDSYQRTLLMKLRLPDLEFVAEGFVDFGFHEHSPMARPYWLGDWGGGRNTGGLLLFDGSPGWTQFISVGLDPETFNPNPAAENDVVTFRWDTGGQALGQVGEALPTPLFRAPGAVLGHAFGEMPRKVETE
jgi:hypothetical protein